MQLDTKKLRELAEAATPGPWIYYELPQERDGIGYIRPQDFDGKEIAHHGEERRGAQENRANGELIVAMRNSLPALLDRLAALELVREAAEAVHLYQSIRAYRALDAALTATRELPDAALTGDVQCVQ